jgi:hypothetical protein
MTKLICDNCKKPILNCTVYYVIQQKANNNDFFKDKQIELCPDCTERLTINKAIKIIS